MKISRKTLAVTAAGVCLAAGGAAAGLMLTAGPGYPHSWCAPVEATISQRGASESQYEQELAGEASQGAPLSQLLADLQAYDAGAAAASSNFTALDGLTGQMAALGQVGSDLKAIDLDCGVPVSAAARQDI